MWAGLMRTVTLMGTACVEVPAGGQACKYSWVTQVCPHTRTLSVPGPLPLLGTSAGTRGGETALAFGVTALLWPLRGAVQRGFPRQGPPCFCLFAK